MARRRLPGPIFHYIDGAADDEITYRRNTEAFERCDLVPNVLAGVENIDMSTTVMGQKLNMPLFCSPTALQRLFHHDGERAVAKAAEKFGTMFGISSLGTVSVEEIGSTISTPKLFQLYFHKDRGLTNSMIERCLAANFDVLALTVDTITGGNRERDLRTGFTSPPRLTLKSLFSFALHPAWAFNYFTREKIELPQLKDYVAEGSDVSISVGEYFSVMLDQSMNWQDAENVRKQWGRQFCLKGIMSVADARRALDIGATAIIVSNHGGRQLFCRIQLLIFPQPLIIATGTSRATLVVTPVAAITSTTCSTSLYAAGASSISPLAEAARTSIRMSWSSCRRRL
jgi:L-lactate dehydrogenase (cytochrome)